MIIRTEDKDLYIKDSNVFSIEFIGKQNDDDIVYNYAITVFFDGSTTGLSAKLCQDDFVKLKRYCNSLKT